LLIAVRYMFQMQKDLKAGMFFGLLVVVAAALWFATRPSLMTESRLLQSPKTVSEQPPAKSPRFVTNLPSTPTAEAPVPIQPEENHQPQLKPPAHQQAKTTKSPRIHTVSNGETLSSIARRYYGSEYQWQKIYNANRSRLKSPDKIRLGTRLIIPD